MTFIQALLLGLLQGATEFLPISSSGHLVLVPWLFGWPKPGLAFDALLHWGTILAVLIVFRHDLYRLMLAGFNSLRTRKLDEPDARLAWWIVLGNIPALILGVLFHDFFETLFGTPAAVAGFLLLTGFILFIGERFASQKHSMQEISLFDALLVGLAQAAAITPGISRSGATIAAGLLLGVRRAAAARFSFLLMTPAVLGAGVLALFDLAHEGNLIYEWPLLITGFLAAAISGYLAIRWLLNYLTRRSLTVFAFYCTIVGLGGLILSAIRG
jgi:undecaprenyl-diphosphatase